MECVHTRISPIVERERYHKTLWTEAMTASPSDGMDARPQRSLSHYRCLVQSEKPLQCIMVFQEDLLLNHRGSTSRYTDGGPQKRPPSTRESIGWNNATA